MRGLSAYLVGLIFALGLALSGMTDPKQVIAFLEIGPRWSERLLFVMGGALTVSFIGLRWVKRRHHPVLDSSFHTPATTPVSRGLILGSVIFGIGWGISGYCPGPLVTGLSRLEVTPWVIFGCFMLGQWFARKARGNPDSKKK